MDAASDTDTDGTRLVGAELQGRSVTHAEGILARPGEVAWVATHSDSLPIAGQMRERHLEV